ncbi:WD40 repeat domain-containing protein [Streptomyces hydrogenans]|uniref:WD40 repeat domain-containing protein n=1 Tax=Streptomyces hydrogenans TaxID=1873719 RepID=UPI0037F9D37D
MAFGAGRFATLRKIPPRAHRATVWWFQLSDDGRLAATGSRDDTARLWDVDTGALLREFTGHADHVPEVRLGEDGDRLLTADSAGTVRLWRTDTGACLRTPACDRRAPAGTLRPAAVCPLPGGERAVVAMSNAVRWWNLRDGGVERTLEEPVAHRGEKVLAVAPDSRGGVRLLDAADGTVLHTLTDPRARDSLLHENPARLCFTAGGRRLFVAGGMGVGADVVRVWDVATGAALHEFAAPGGCTSLAVTADGGFALSGGTGSHVLAWDVPAGRRLRTLDTHAGRLSMVRSTANSPSTAPWTEP